MSTTKNTNSEITERLALVVSELADGNVTAFAKKVRIPQATLHNYIKGRTPSIESLYNICNSYRISLNWLVVGVGPKYIEGDSQEEPREKLSSDKTSKLTDEDPEVADLLEGARRVLKSGNPIAFDALERNIRYFDHAVASEKRLLAVEAKLEELMQVLSERKKPKKAANDE